MTDPLPLNPTGAVFVTGATGGLGRSIIERISTQGRPVVVAGRRPEAVESIVQHVHATGGTATGFVANLADLSAIERALETTELPPLHGIVANAGISTENTSAATEQGFDLTFGVNVLAHQLLLHLLSPRLLHGCRIVIVSSGVHHPGNTLARRLRVPLPTWHGTEKLAHQQAQTGAALLSSGAARYSTSKLANVYQAQELQRRLDDLEMEPEVFALDPGLMVDTDLAREAPAPARFLLRTVGRAITPLVANMRLSTTTAGFVSDLIESPAWTQKGFAYVDGNAVEPLGELALRADNANELWTTATEMVGVKPTDTLFTLRR